MIILSEKEIAVRTELYNRFIKDVNSKNFEALKFKEYVLDFFEDEEVKKKVLFLIADLASTKGEEVNVDYGIDQIEKLGLSDHTIDILNLLAPEGVTYG